MTTLLQGVRVTLNGYSTGAGCPLGVAAIRGLDDMPDLRTSDTARPGRDGDYAGTDLLASRVVEVDWSRTLDLTAVPDVLDALRRATVRGDSEMLVEGLPGLPALWLRGRVRKAQIPMDGALAVGLVKPKLQFYCPDPLRYAAIETVLTLDLRAVAGDGLFYDSDVPYDTDVPYDGGGTAAVYLVPPWTPPITPASRPGMIGNLTATNTGVYATCPLIRVFGPCPSFSLLQGTTNRTWGYSTAVADGDFVEVDMAARTVLLNGEASRREFKRGAWWDLPPGDSSIAFLPDSPAVGAQVEVRFRSAY